MLFFFSINLDNKKISPCVQRGHTVCVLRTCEGLRKPTWPPPTPHKGEGSQGVSKIANNFTPNGPDTHATLLWNIPPGRCKKSAKLVRKKLNSKKCPEFLSILLPPPAPPTILNNCVLAGCFNSVQQSWPAAALGAPSRAGTWGGSRYMS